VINKRAPDMNSPPRTPSPVWVRWCYNSSSKQSKSFNLNEKWPLKKVAIKNSAAKDPEGYLSLLDSAMCNAGLVMSARFYFEQSGTQQGKYDFCERARGSSVLYRNSEWPVLTLVASKCLKLGLQTRQTIVLA
jgi:hypothetical protein